VADRRHRQSDAIEPDGYLWERPEATDLGWPASVIL
jgi:hypothetical protein